MIPSVGEGDINTVVLHRHKLSQLRVSRQLRTNLCSDVVVFEWNTFSIKTALKAVRSIPE